MSERGLAPWLLGLSVLGLVGVTLAFPAYQIAQTGGFTIFQNGADESTYLQYDFSVLAQGLTRPGQYLVSLLHALGLSGGWINVVLDALALVAFPWLAQRIFRRLGWDERASVFGALSLVVLPMVFLSANPLVRWLSEWNVASGTLYWLNMPALVASPLLRTPEPQFSLLLLAAGIWVGLRLKAFWPVYVTLPFMYPFVAIPAAFVALACQARERFRNGPAAVTLSLAAVAVSGAVGVYYAYFVGDKLKLLLVATRLPLFSFTGAIALACYALLRVRIDPSLRFVALALAWAPWLASNHQLLSGYIAQPDNFEQYVGVVAIAGVLALGLARHVRLRSLALAAGALFFTYSCYSGFRTHQIQEARLPLKPELIAALRDDPGHVVVNDVSIASSLSLTHPRQGSTALGHDRTFLPMAPRHIAFYRCLKEQVRAEHPENLGFRHSFAFLDVAYAYGSQNFVLAHLGRKTAFTKLHDVDAPCTDRRKVPLRYFFVR